MITSDTSKIFLTKKFDKYSNLQKCIILILVINYIEYYLDVIKYGNKFIDEFNQEYWLARELSKVLEYRDCRKFLKVIDKAVISAKNSTSNEEDWGVEVNKPIQTGKGKEEMN